MTAETAAIEPDLNHDLSEALVAVLTAADGPPERAMVDDPLVEEIVNVVASDPSVDNAERDSLSPVLDAADEHGERMGAFASWPDSSRLRPVADPPHDESEFFRAK